MTPHHTLQIALLGECMIELKQQGEGVVRQAFSGDTLNTAVYLKRLLTGRTINPQISYFTALGTDEFSLAMLAMWQGEGIDTQSVRRIPDKQPGLYYIHVDASGERQFSYWRNDSAAKYVFTGAKGPEYISRLLKFDTVYLSGISLAILPENEREQLLDALVSYTGKLIFDNNYRPRLWTKPEIARKAYTKLLRCCDTALLTWDDEQALFGFNNTDELRKQCDSLGVREVVVKQGEGDCLVFFEGETLSIPAHKVTNVVDTTAAGDSFSAAYVAARMLSHAPEQAARWGHLLASTVIQHEGGIIPKAAMPDILMANPVEQNKKVNP